MEAFSLVPQSADRRYSTTSSQHSTNSDVWASGRNVQSQGSLRFGYASSRSRTSSRRSRRTSVRSFGAMRQYVLDACKLPATGKLAAGAVLTITDEELHELSDVLAQGGRIRSSDLAGYFSISLQGCTADDIDVLLANCGCGEDALNRSHDISFAMFRDNFRTETVANIVASRIEAIGRETPAGGVVEIENDLDREAFVEKAALHLAREDALKTLPTTSLFLIVFIGLVVFHLKIVERHQVEKGVEIWMNGYGPYDGPFIADISDVGSFWNWLENSGVEAIFASTRVASDGTHSIPRVAAVNDVIGDARLSRVLIDGSSQQAWLRQSGELALGNTGSPSMFDEALAGARDLKSRGFLPVGDVSEIRLAFCTHNKQAAMFVKAELTVEFGAYGASVVTMGAGAIIAQAYSDPIAMFTFDAIYVIILLYIATLEILDMLLAAKSGWGHFLAYFGFWNVVDLMSISLGVLNILVAYDAFVLKQVDSFSRLHDETSGKQIEEAAALSPTTLQNIFDDLGALQTTFQHLHYIIAFNTVSIVMRFFKAFTANRRLQVVADTFKGCFEDMVHFLLVFGVIYVSFVITGHLLFGKDIVEFYTIASSASIALAALMGEHGWYLEACRTDLAVLSSGMPVIVLHAWFVAFMVCVSLVTFNMLLAIILDSYASALGNMGKFQSPPTLFQQCRNQAELRRETWDFIPLKEIHDFFAHSGAAKDASITSSSMREHFSTMTPQQADSLIMRVGKLMYEDEEAARDSDDVSREKRMCRCLDAAVMETMALGDRFLRCKLGLESINRRIEVLDMCASGTALSRESTRLPPRAAPFLQARLQALKRECSCQTEADEEPPNFLKQKRRPVETQSLCRTDTEQMREDSRHVADNDDNEYSFPHVQDEPRLQILATFPGRMCCFNDSNAASNASAKKDISWRQAQAALPMVSDSSVPLGEFSFAEYLMAESMACEASI